MKADSSFDLSRTVGWPMLRSFPNKTRANLVRTFNVNVLETVYINEKKLPKKYGSLRCTARLDLHAANGRNIRSQE